MSNQKTEFQGSITQCNGEPDTTGSKADAARRFFEVPQTYLARNFNIRARAHIVAKLLGEVRSKAILDIGCGDGSVSRQFLSESNQLTLLDLSANMLSIAQAQTPPEYLHRIRYINGDFSACALTNEFDVVLCLGVLAHVDSVSGTIRRITSALKPKGVCVLQITDAESLFSRAMRVYGAIRRAKAAELGYVTNRTTSSMLVTLAAENGLQFLNQCRYSLLLPGMLRLPDNFLYRYQIATAESKWLSGLGTEVLFHFKKV